MTDPKPNGTAAALMIRRAVKRTCAMWPCNHINCNRTWAGCVNEPGEPVAAALAEAFRIAGQPGWADAIDAQMRAHRDDADQ